MPNVTLWLCALATLGLSAWAQAQTPIVRFQVKGYSVQGNNPLTTAETEAALSPFIGEQEGLEGVLAASKGLEAAIRERGHAFHRVVLAPQAMADGIVQLDIIAYKVASVMVQGNERFSTENIQRSLPGLEVGGSINTRHIARATRFANQHPAKQVKLAFSDSKTRGGIDAHVRVEESRPWGLFAALDNTGSEETGRGRLTLGASHFNLFDRDHQLTASYTTSPEQTEDVRQLGVSYTAPLYSNAISVSAFFVDSDVNSGQISGFDISGAGRFAGLSATHALLPIGRYNHAVTVGVQDKLFQSDVVPLGGAGSLFPDVRSRPLSFGYVGSYTLASGELRFNVDYARNLGFGGATDDSAYAANRLDADAGWKVWRMGLSFDRAIFDGAIVRLQMAGQWASEPLISGEQFGIGGARSVRGFEERAASGERGMSLSAEIWSPPIALPETWDANLRVLALADWGHVEVDTPATGQESNESLASVGVGMRAQAGPIRAQASFAQVLDGVGSSSSTDHRLQFSLFWRY